MSHEAKADTAQLPLVKQSCSRHCPSTVLGSATARINCSLGYQVDLTLRCCKYSYQLQGEGQVVMAVCCSIYAAYICLSDKALDQGTYVCLAGGI